MHNFRRLTVWQKAHAATIEIERLLDRIPRRHNVDLINQTRRAAVAIPANIVLGSGRVSDRDFSHYLDVALASAAETEYHLQLAADTRRISRVDFAARQAELVEIRKMLVGLIKRLKPKGQSVV